jgi:hypothetical protein
MVVSGSRKYIVSLLVVGMLLASGLGWAVPTVAQGTEGEPDLPAMVLRTWDIVEAGIDKKLFPFGGQCAQVEQQALYLSLRTGIDAATIIDDLNDAGLALTCRQAYAELEEGNAANRQPVSLVISSVSYFDDEDGALDGFDLLTDVESNPDAADVPIGEDYSRRSKATVLTSSDNTGEFSELELTFLIDNLIATVSLRTYSDEVPEYGDEIEALADILTDKIDAVLDGGSPGFGPLVVGVEADNLLPVANYSYHLFDGNSEPSASETPETYEQRTDDYGDASFILTSTRMLPASASGARSDIQMGVQLVQLDDEDAASDWIADHVDLKQEDSEVFDLLIRENVPTYGDESIALVWGGEAGTYDRIVGRVGDVVFNLGFTGTGLPEDGAEIFAAAQVECLENGACDRTLNLADIFADAGDADTDPPDDDEDDTAAGETFESELYPYTLTFDDSWSLDDPSIAGDTEILSMSNGTSSVVIIAGTTHNGDVESCLDGAIDYISGNDENSDVETLLDDNGDPVEEYDDDRAFTALGYTSGDDADLIVYLECRVLVPGESTIEFNQYTMADDYDDQVDAREDLLDGLDID